MVLYICTCIYMHTRIHAYTHTCIHAYMHTCIHVYIHTGIHISMYKQIYIYVYIYVYMYVYIYVCTYAYIYIYRCEKIFEQRGLLRICEIGFPHRRALYPCLEESTLDRVKDAYINESMCSKAMWTSSLRALTGSRASRVQPMGR